MALLVSLALRPEAGAQQHILDWDDAANAWDFVGESAATEVESISEVFNDVDMSGVDVTVTISADDGVDMTSQNDPARDSLSDWLNEDAKHAGIFSLFTNNGADGNTLNMGMNEGDRDDMVVTCFKFSSPVRNVSFVLYDIDKTNWDGPLGAEVSNRGSGWIDEVTVTGLNGTTPVSPVFSGIASASTSSSLNPYQNNDDDGGPGPAISPNDYVLADGNVLRGRWEVSEKDSNNANTPENNLWATDGVYGGVTGNARVTFPDAVTEICLHHNNSWTVVGDDSRTSPDEYWGGHSMEFGIGDLVFEASKGCVVEFTTVTGAPVAGYREGDAIYVTLTDADLNLDPASKDTVVITVQNADNGDSETITLTETAIGSGVFRNTTGLPTSTDPVAIGDGTIQLSPGDTLSTSAISPITGPCTSTASVLRQPDFTKTVDPASAGPGDTVTYSFAPRYPGKELLADVTVRDVLPPLTIFDTVTQGGTYDSSTDSVSWSLGSNDPANDGAVAAGVSFSTFEQVTSSVNGNTSIEPGIAVVDTSGVAHLVFESKGPVDGKRNIFYSNDSAGAGTWSTPLLLSDDTDGQDALDASVAIDSNGDIHVIYTDKSAGDGKRNAYYVKVTFPGGVPTASTPLQVSSDLENVVGTDIAVDGSGNVHIVFEDKLAADNKINIYYAVSTNGGTSFSTAERVSDDHADGSNALDPTIAVESDGTVHIAYVDVFSDGTTTDDKNNIYHVTGTAGSFGTPQRLSDDGDGQNAFDPEIAVETDGTVHAVWLDKTAPDQNTNVYYATDGGTGTFGAISRLSVDGDQNAAAPTIATDPAGDVHVAWQDKEGTDGKVNVYYSTDRSGSFSTPFNVTNDYDSATTSADSLNPAIVVSSSGMHLTFQNAATGQHEVYYTEGAFLPASTTVISAFPTLVVDDGIAPDTITVEVTLGSSEALTGVAPPALTISGTAGATYVSGPVPATADISAGGTATFTYTYTALAAATPGEVTFSLADFSSAGADFGAADSNSVLVSPVLEYTVIIEDPPGGIPPGLETVKNIGTLSDSSGVLPPSPSNEVATDIASGVDQSAVLGDRIWLDEDGDGVQDAGEDGIANVTVYLLDQNGNIIDTTTTDADGYYLFPDVQAEILAANYTVAVDTSTLPDGLHQTYDEDGLSSPDSIDVALDPGGEHMTASFGYNYVPPADSDSPTAGTTGAIGDTIWLDADGDGVQDPGEAGIEGVTVYLYTDPDGDGIYSTPAGTAVTGPDGSYIFDDLAPDSYVVTVDETTLPAGYVQTGDPDGSLDSGTSSPIALGPGDVYLNADFGYQPVSGGSDIGDTIYLDLDGDGVLDSGETGIAGVTVSLLDSNGMVIASTTTDENGEYLFPDLPAGTYTVEVTDNANVLGDLVQSGDPDSPLAPDLTSTVTVDGTATGSDLDQDFGFTPPDVPAVMGTGSGVIGDTLYYDLDGDGIQDPGEPGMEGVVVSLTLGGTTIYTTTDENGNYYFAGLDETATYTVDVVEETLPDGVLNSDDPDAGTPDGVSIVDLSTYTGGIALDQDFGFSPENSNTIGGTIWLDPDASGTLDGTESGNGIEGVTVELRDLDGNVVATTTTNANGEYEFLNVPDGDYFVEVTDAANILNGYWDSNGPSPGSDDNSQTGPYPVSVFGGVTDTTGDFGYYLDSGALGNFVWNDLNDDGIQDPGEPGIEGAVVTLTITYPSGDVVTVQTLTDASGFYSFDNLLLDEDYDGIGTPGVDEPAYELSVATPDGFVASTQLDKGGDETADAEDPAGESAVTTEGVFNDTYDFAFVEAPPGAVIGNRIWLDEDGDGVQDAGEDGISGVTVHLRDSGGNIIATTTTDANGGYLFTDVPAGDYTVEVDTTTMPAGLAANPTYDEDDQTTNPDGQTAVTVAPGDEYLTADFGYNWTSTTDTQNPDATATGAIGDYLWIDADGDGVQDAGEAGIPGVTVNLYTDPDGDGVYDNLVTSTTTDGTGHYIFDGLDPDSYVVEVVDTTLPAGYTQTGDPDGTLDNASDPIPLAPGDVYLNADFGYDPAAGSDVGDTIYFDADGDGTQDLGEPGIAGVTVALLDPDGNVIATTTTDENGEYLFPSLPSGSYTVLVTDTDNVLDGLFNTGDPDLGNDGETSVSLDGVNPDLGADFGYAPDGHDAGEGLIGDTVFLDGDGDGQPGPGEGVEGVTVELYDATGSTLLATTTTDENGNYSFGGLDPAATYTVVVDTTGTILDGLDNTVDPNSGSDSESIVDLSASGGINLDQDFGYVPSADPNSIGGTIWADTDADGTLDESGTGLEGVTVDLLDADGNVVATTTTDEFGNYSFGNLPDGTYTVDVTDDANVLGGYWHSVSGDQASDGTSKSDPFTVSVNGGETNTTADFGYYIEPASLGDFVWYDLDGDGIQDDGEPGLEGVEVTLTIDYPNGEQVVLTTTTAADGSYSFENLLADESFAASGGVGEPTYTVTVATPEGFTPSPSNTGSDDAVDSDDGTAGEDVVVAQGGSDQTNDFGFVDPKGNTYAGFVALNGLTGADAQAVPDDGGLGGNPDGDNDSNLLEHALCNDPNSGLVSHQGFCVELFDQATGQIDASFTRPEGVEDVIYTLQGSGDFADSTAWTDIATIPAGGALPAGFTATSNGDGSETVTFGDVSTTTAGTAAGLTADFGLLRLCVSLDVDKNGEPDTLGDGTVITDYTRTFGYQCTDYNAAQCASFSSPFSEKTVFSGTVDGITGDVVDVSTAAAGADLSAAIAAGGAYYLQVTSGPLEGYRWDIASAGVDSITLVNDPDIFSESDGVQSLNTSDGLPSNADLAGSTFEILPHRTVDEMFDKTTTFAGLESTSPSQAAALLIYDNRLDTPQWVKLILVDDTLGASGEIKWVRSDDLGALTDQGGMRIDRCMGNYIHPMLGGCTQYAVGMVADYDIACAFNEGFNLGGALWPMDQSPAGPDDGRGMTIPELQGGKSPNAAAELYFWKGDEAVDAGTSYLEGYESIFLLEYPGFNYWTDINDRFLTNMDGDPILESHRAFTLKLEPGNTLEPLVSPYPGP